MLAEKIESQIQLLEFHIKLCVIFLRLWISVKKLLILAEVAIRVRKLHCIFVCVYGFVILRRCIVPLDTALIKS